jgi:hypothetical protein
VSVPFCIIKNRDNFPSSSTSFHHPTNETQARNKIVFLAAVYLLFSLSFQIDVLRIITPVVSVGYKIERPPQKDYITAVDVAAGTPSCPRKLLLYMCRGSDMMDTELANSLVACYSSCLQEDFGVTEASGYSV